MPSANAVAKAAAANANLVPVPVGEEKACRRKGPSVASGVHHTEIESSSTVFAVEGASAIRLQVTPANFIHWAVHGGPEELRSFLQRGAQLQWRYQEIRHCWLP